MGKTGWIGVDLDGTLAHYDPQHNIEVIGDPIDAIEFRIRQWVESGIEVRVFTARGTDEQLVQGVKKWMAIFFDELKREHIMTGRYRCMGCKYCRISYFC